MDRSTYPIEIAIAVLVLLGIIYVAGHVSEQPTKGGGTEPSGQVVPVTGATGGGSIGVGGSRTQPTMKAVDLPKD